MCVEYQGSNRFEIVATVGYDGDVCTQCKKDDGPPINVQINVKCAPQTREGGLLKLWTPMIRRETHDTLYSQTYAPAYLRPRLTLLVHASTIMLLRHCCWSAEVKSLSAEIELR